MSQENVELSRQILAAFNQRDKHQPEKLPMWENGWKHRDRPSLRTMLAAVGERHFEHVEIDPFFTREYNSLSHGDPSSAAFNLTFTDEGEPIFWVSKDLENAELCDRVCSEATVWLAQLVLAGTRIFPEQVDDHA